MLRPSRSGCVLVFIMAIALSGAAQIAASNSRSEDRDREHALQSFAAIRPIDAHVHVFKTDPAFQNMLQRLNLKLLNVLVMDDTLSYRKQLQPQVDDAMALVKSGSGHIAFCTTFDPYLFDSAHFAEGAIQQLDRDYTQGAVAVKIWKNIGMEIKDRNGAYIFADDPKFDSIYRDIAKHGKTLLSHQAEPDVAWGPADPADPVWSYYQEHPQWYVANKAGFPSKQRILEARDHVLAKNPELRMVGVHLGSMEKDLDNIVRHLDQYPNFAVDTAARMEYLMIQPVEKARNFLIKFQDRIIYGTDLDLLGTANIQEALADWQSTYARDWRFLATGDTFIVEGREVHGLNLPGPVLRKIFRSNAKRWIPGL